MNTGSTQQEILLVAGTSFSSRESCKSGEWHNYDQLTEKEKLKAACRNGFLPDMLPEIFKQHPLINKLYLWEMSKGSLFIELKRDEKYLELEMQFSIDPYSFLAVHIFS